MLGDVDRRAAVLAAESEALRESKNHEDERSEDPYLLIRRQDADHERRATHDQQRDEERVLPADEISDAAEDDRAERTHGETSRKCAEGVKEAGGRVVLRKEESRHDCRETSENVEVVPLDHRAGGG